MVCRLCRAECLAVVVYGAGLLDGAWTKIEDLRRLHLIAHAEAAALQPRTDQRIAPANVTRRRQSRSSEL